MTDIRSRILGCLLGGAAGDALGYAVEFDRWRSIEKASGPCGIQEYALSGGLAVISDDTQMTLFTAEGLVEAVDTGKSADRCMYQAYLDWLDTQERSRRGKRIGWLMSCEALWYRRAPGITCLNALQSGRMGSKTELINRSKGCGAVMRSAPCGFAPPSLAPAGTAADDTAAELGAECGLITHCHPLGWLSAALLSDIVYRIAYCGEPSVDSAVRGSLATLRRLWGSEPELAVLDRLCLKALDLVGQDLPDRECLNILGEGWIGEEAIAVAIFCAARHQDDFDACLRAAVNHSGDSDSTGAIAGNILGAFLGASALDSRWVEPLDAREALFRTADELSRVARR